MQNIALGQYFPGTSVVHRLDPRIKLSMTIALIALIFFVHTYLGYLAILCLLYTSRCV